MGMSVRMVTHLFLWHKIKPSEPRLVLRVITYPLIIRKRLYGLLSALYGLQIIQLVLCHFIDLEKPVLIEWKELLWISVWSANLHLPGHPFFNGLRGEVS